jgi:hypothetical protein
VNLLWRIWYKFKRCPAWRQIDTTVLTRRLNRGKRYKD